MYGISSGAALAMEAALKLGGKVKKLAMYEAPYNDDKEARKATKEYRHKLDEIVAEGRKSDAVDVEVPQRSPERCRHRVRAARGRRGGIGKSDRRRGAHDSPSRR